MVLKIYNEQFGVNLIFTVNSWALCNINLTGAYISLSGVKIERPLPLPAED